MVDVEIGDGDALQTRILSGAGGESDVGKQAKPHGPRRFSVMTGWSYDAKGALDLSRRHRPRRGDRPAGRQTRGAHGSGGHEGIGIEALVAVARRDGGKRRHVLGAMNALEIREARRLGFVLIEAQVRGVAQGVHRRDQTLGPFRVTGLGPVVQHVGMGVDGEVHDASLSGSPEWKPSGRRPRTTPTPWPGSAARRSTRHLAICTARPISRALFATTMR